MAWVPIAATVIGTVMQIKGAGDAAAAARAQGQAQQVQDQYQATQMEQQAGQEIAAKQRSAAEQTRQANLLASRAIAVAGASGGGVSDPSVANLIADISGEGAYRAGVQLYQGEENARQLRMGSGAKLYEGQVAAQGGDLKAQGFENAGLGAAFKGAESIYDKFGFGGSKAGGGGGGGGGTATTGNGWMDAGTQAMSAFT